MRFRADTHPPQALIFPARPARVDRQRWHTPPTLHQPLSHGAERRDSSPFRGAEGVGGGLRRWRNCLPRCGYLRLTTTVGGGVLDAPPSRDCRGGLVADVRRGRLHPRLMRRARWRPPPHISNHTGTARTLFCTGAPTPSVSRRAHYMQKGPVLDRSFLLKRPRAFQAAFARASEAIFAASPWSWATSRTTYCPPEIMSAFSSLGTSSGS